MTSEGGHDVIGRNKIVLETTLLTFATFHRQLRVIVRAINLYDPEYSYLVVKMERDRQ